MTKFRKGEDVQVKDFIFPEHKRTLLISDLHIPYHETDAIEEAIKTAEKHDVDSVLINGDMLDLYKCSRFTKDPTRMNVIDELNMGVEFLKWIQGRLPKAKIYYKYGNHEERYELFLKSKAPELFGDAFWELRNRLGLDNLGVQEIKGKALVKYGALNIIHGHEFGESTFSPVNPARGFFMRAKANVIAGHNHQTSEHHENNLNGDEIGCWSIGCLCELKPEYRPFAYTKWNWGFAILERDKDKFQVNNRRILI